MNMEINQNQLDQATLQLQDYLQKLDTKCMMVKKRQIMLIQGKYFSMINYLKEQRYQLDRKYQKHKQIMFDMDNDEEIQAYKLQLVSFKQFSEDLKQNHNEFENQWKQKQEQIENNLETINKKKAILKQINHENISLGSQYTKTQKILEFIQSSKLNSDKKNVKFATQSFKVDSNDPQISEEFKEALHQLNELQIQNQQLINQFKQECIKQIELKKFFENCMKLNSHKLFQSQEISKENGLAQSMLFEITKPKKSDQLQIFQSNSQNRTTSRGFYSTESDKQKQIFQVPKLQDGAYRHLVHGALKNAVQKKRLKKLPIAPQLLLPEEVFDKFNHLQIMGIIQLKPFIFKSLMEQKTQKMKEIHFLIKEFQFLIQQTNQSQQQN